MCLYPLAVDTLLSLQTTLDVGELPHHDLILCANHQVADDIAALPSEGSLNL